MEGIGWDEFLNDEELHKIKIDVNKLKSAELATWTFANDTLYFGRINLIEGNN